MKIKDLVALLTTSAVTFSGCSVFDQPPDIAIVRDNGKSEVPVAELARIPELTHLHQYAALSASIYIDSATKSTKSFDEFCQSKDVLYQPEGWAPEKELPGFPETPSHSYKVNGLKYEVWVNKSLTSLPLILVVFRGTDANQLGDWLSNFRWVTRFIPFLWDQYDQTRDLVPGLVQHIREKYGNDTEIVTTGHSLGGGLAQQAAYMSQYIHKVYAFDPSSVTGYYSVDKSDRTKNEIRMSIYRVYEHGEILAYLRLFMKGLYPITKKDPKIVEIRYNLLGGGIVSEHSMKDFACKLKEIAQSPPSR